MSRRRPSDHGWLAYYRELIGTWARKANSIHDAEDATHDVIANMLEGDASVIHDRRAYLHRSVYHGLLNQHRRQSRERAVPLHELNEDDHPAQADPDAGARLAQLSDALLDALQELPPRCQQVFAWHRLEGWTVPEIAAHMDLSVSSVEKYLARTMRHLHARLQKFND
ncbi:RNA polymerase sigma factor [Bordetella sp. BOR01]|uniref:RNA polymerase sigma factor n=1 Tax=Bordetella sp. BOR01 TaxID=2854779 RepID=UPI001C46E31E|nr:sigma-70 family RNA polymerase sigma factor [Bordetella sp. BOR01]MBV7486390.1 sigma-70 family RNA polymerase sigma factor [Bordetella sp. BOR01]